MRPPRVIIGAAFIATAVFLTFLSLRSSHPSQTIVNSSPTTPKAGIRTLFSFRAPFSLFPPNAIITLTHENSTAFLARPASFGPSLPTAGLKGQVWIGSGFGDDSIRQGPVAAGAEGELGCSDVPGWVESFKKSDSAAPDGGKLAAGESVTVTTKSKAQKRGKEEHRDSRTADSEGSAHVDKSQKKPPVNDGTDDYLHHPLQGSTVTKTTDKQHIDSNGHHADIQSIQEGAEITGKVVLLSRGGCGFLEKVKWAQRRGAIALIVGDDRKGGALIQMYARGDTSNVTIPSIFTSRTTAHLLSSLIGPGSFLEDSIDENGKPTLKVQHTDQVKKPRKKIESGPTFTATTGTTKPTGVTARGSSRNTNLKPAAKTEEKAAVKAPASRGWFMSLFFGNRKSSSESESSRPPSSGQLDWVLVDDWKDDDSAGSKKISTKPKKADVEKKPSQKAKPGTKPSSGDDFVIGVQDWRDPDLVGSSSSKDAENGMKAPPAKAGGKSDATKPKNETPQPTKDSGKKQVGGALQAIPGPLRGGSITPGSGEYGTKKSSSEEKPNEKMAPEAPGSKPKGLLTTIFGDDEEDIELSIPGSHSSTNGVDDMSDGDEDGDDGIEGLWVTLTPTSGASPFLDTLLVLVVSPLVTLTVVYALLLVRSRIRRRRWRAPKSVVERLPVRTYQTIATPAPQTPRQPSPTSSSVTTPLLQPSPPTRPRPRSRTTTGIPEPGDLIRVNSSPLQVPIVGPRTPEHEKPHGSESSEWRKFMGKQVECVVCLEEYVDGVSRVMSLPCGHEFHVDCITPWLTTRRRTCPICKGDVVRSLARGSPSNPRYEPYHDDSDDDAIQVQAAETANTSSSSALPIAATLSDNEDLEQGIVSPTPTRPRRTDRTASWRSILSTNFGSTSRSPRPPQEDRDR